MSIYEIIMLICFGAAWPFSIYKSLKSKSTKGKSSLFMIVLIIGYVFGILNKLLVKYDYVIYLYIIVKSIILCKILYNVLPVSH